MPLELSGALEKATGFNPAGPLDGAGARRVRANDP